MEEAEFLALVNATKANGQYIIGFIFDNSTKLMFGPKCLNKMFTLQEHYDATSKCVVDRRCVDTSGITYTVYKPLSTVQSICVTDKGRVLDNYDPWLMHQ